MCRAFIEVLTHILFKNASTFHLYTKLQTPERSLTQPAVLLEYFARCFALQCYSLLNPIPFSFRCLVTASEKCCISVTKTNVFSLVLSVKAVIEVISGREGTFRVKCTSSGGKTFTMDVEGPGYSVEEQGQMRVEAVGEPQRMGNDTYSATTSVISGGCNGDTYQCTASNGAAPDKSHTVELKGRELVDSVSILSAYL